MFARSRSRRVRPGSPLRLVCTGSLMIVANRDAGPRMTSQFEPERSNEPAALTPQPRIVSGRLGRPRGVRVQIANRIDIGGFTDIDPSRAGAVLSLPIVINEQPITVTASVSDGQSDDLIVAVKPGVTTELIRPVACSFIVRHGVRGAIAINIECATACGSGAGASSQITAAVVAALSRCIGRVATRTELAREAYQLETTLTSCGWQDQAPLVVGRCGFISAAPAASPDAVAADYQTIPVSEPVLAELERRGLLVWTGQSHFSRSILDGVKTRLSRGVPDALHAWEALYSLAREARNTLVGDGSAEARVDHLALIVAANWAAEIELSDGMVATEKLLAVDPQLRVLGGYKLLGAGRGGFLFFIERSAPATAAAAELLGGVSDWRVEQWRIDRMPARVHPLPFATDCSSGSGSCLQVNSNG